MSSPSIRSSLAATEQIAKKAKSTLAGTSVRLKKSTIRLLRTLVNKANKKSYGRKIHVDDVIKKSLENCGDSMLEEIKEESLTGSDRIDMAYKKFCRDRGHVSKEEYLVQLLEAGKDSMKQENQKEEGDSHDSI